MNRWASCAAIGQVAAVVDEAKGVDDRHAQQRAFHPPHGRGAQQSTHDFDADDLIAVYGGRNKQHRPRALAVHHMNGHVHLRVVRQHADRHVDGAAFAGLNSDAVKDVRRRHGLAFALGFGFSRLGGFFQKLDDLAVDVDVGGVFDAFQAGR